VSIEKGPGVSPKIDPRFDKSEYLCRVKAFFPLGRGITKKGTFAFLMLPPAVAVEEQLGNRDSPPCPLKGSVFSDFAGISGRFEFFLLVFQNPDIAGIFGIAFLDGNTVVLAAEGVFGNKYIFALGALDDSILGIPKAYQMFLTKSTEACFNLIRVRGLGYQPLVITNMSCFYSMFKLGINELLAGQAGTGSGK
jgi:hypothetical protein